MAGFIKDQDKGFNIMKIFHKKISLSILPNEFYYPFKSFYRTLILQNTFDLGAILTLTELGRNKSDTEGYVSNIMQGFTIVMRKLEHNESELKKSKDIKAFKITPFTYTYMITALHFLLANYKSPSFTNKCSHEDDDACKYCNGAHEEIVYRKTMVSYLNSILPHKK